ncbi:hypothetical protein HG537_0C03840 [Torulaspora globosa]|uniref:Uncharacterized protein n=1 Tax=Torulaspora globosa TaxID=48254 RepID=A0A7H9HTK2_9SACH|nr:hypothetical protein HG537_0C03840 [Torulaspora sp. CBS 2947]
MAVMRKRRVFNAKTNRQQQLQQQQQLRAKQRFESSRLKPEPSTTTIHDESDTISFRSYLLMNFVKSAEYMDVLMTQPIPNDKIRPPALFPSSRTLEAMKERLRVQREQLRGAKEALESFSWGMDGKLRFLKDKLAETENGCEETEPVLDEYLREFGLRSQTGRVAFHRNKFIHLRGDMREAPADYWQQYTQRLEQERKKALAAKQEEEQRKEKLRVMEMEKRKKEIEEERRREELERQKQLEQLQRNAMSQLDPLHEHLTFPGSNEESFSQAHTIANPQYAVPGQISASSNPLQMQEQLQSNSQQYFNQQAPQQTESVQLQQREPMMQDQSVLQNQPQQRQQQQQQLQPQQQQQQQQQQQNQQSQQPIANGVESIFGFEEEPFNNGFEEDFGELDTAFF